MKSKIKIGDTVRLKRDQTDAKYRPHAVVVGGMVDVDGGVIVSPPLERFRYWNVSALEKHKPKGGKHD